MFDQLIVRIKASIDIDIIHIHQVALNNVLNVLGDVFRCDGAIYRRLSGMRRQEEGLNR